MWRTRPWPPLGRLVPETFRAREHRKQIARTLRESKRYSQTCPSSLLLAANGASALQMDTPTESRGTPQHSACFAQRTDSSQPSLTVLSIVMQILSVQCPDSLARSAPPQCQIMPTRPRYATFPATFAPPYRLTTPISSTRQAGASRDFPPPEAAVSSSTSQQLDPPFTRSNHSRLAHPSYSLQPIRSPASTRANGRLAWWRILCRWSRKRPCAVYGLPHFPPGAGPGPGCTTSRSKRGNERSSSDSGKQFTPPDSQETVMNTLGRCQSQKRKNIEEETHRARQL